MRIIQRTGNQSGDGFRTWNSPAGLRARKASGLLDVLSKLKCPVFLASEMSVSPFPLPMGVRLRSRRGCGKVGIPPGLRDSQAQGKTCFWFSTERLFHSLPPPSRFFQQGPALRVIPSHDMRSVADGPSAIQMLVHRDPASGQTAAPIGAFDLQPQILNAHRVVASYGARLLEREDEVQVSSPTGQNRAARLGRWDAEALVELGHAVLPQELVGGFQRVDPAQAQFLREPPLPGAEVPLRTPARLRRVGRDHRNAQLLQRSAHWRELPRIDLPPRLGVSKKWLARSLYSAQKTPRRSTTSRNAASTVRVDSSSPVGRSRSRWWHRRAPPASRTSAHPETSGADCRRYATASPVAAVAVAACGAFLAGAPAPPAPPPAKSLSPSCSSAGSDVRRASRESAAGSDRNSAPGTAPAPAPPPPPAHAWERAGLSCGRPARGTRTPHSAPASAADAGR